MRSNDLPQYSQLVWFRLLPRTKGGGVWNLDSALQTWLLARALCNGQEPPLMLLGSLRPPRRTLGKSKLVASGKGATSFSKFEDTAAGRRLRPSGGTGLDAGPRSSLQNGSALVQLLPVSEEERINAGRRRGQS